LRTSYRESAEHAPDGVIIYIKPACPGDEPRDIYEYFKTNPTFPHESPGDQLFSESQFESYRMLGAHTMEKFCTDCDGDFLCFVRDILKRHLQMEAPVWLAKLVSESHLARFRCLAPPLATSTRLLALQRWTSTPEMQIRPLALQRFYSTPAPRTQRLAPLRGSTTPQAATTFILATAVLMASLM
jgi:hypothetical protein